MSAPMEMEYASEYPVESTQWEDEQWDEGYGGGYDEYDIEAGPEVPEEEMDEAIEIDHGENIGGFSYDAVRNGAWFNMLSGSDCGVTHFIMVSRDLATLIVATSPPPTLTDPIEIPLNLISDVQVLGYEDQTSATTMIISMGDNELRIGAPTAEIAEEWTIVLAKLSTKANNERPLNAKRKRNMRKHVADAIEAPGRMNRGWKIVLAVLAVLLIVGGIVFLVLAK